MKIVVVVDNNTSIDEYYFGEPAVCYYIEDEESKILFDTGYSDICIKNAKKLHIDLDQISAIAISHGHNDHTNGLQYIMEQYDMRNTSIVAHPDAFTDKTFKNEKIGAPYTIEQLKDKCKLNCTKKPMRLSNNVVFLGEIPPSNMFEERKCIGEDKIYDDSAIVYRGETGLFVITGCSHSGVCNIVEYAKQVCNENRISGILGGFHLFNVNQQLHDTIQYFKDNKITNLYPCHCVSFPVKAEIHKYISVNEVGVGLTLEIV